MARAQYEKYDRRGPEIFVGEWAAYETREELRCRSDELLRAAARQRRPWRAPVASQSDRVRGAARLRIAELSRDQNVQHARGGSDSAGHADRHRRARLGDPR